MRKVVGVLRGGPSSEYEVSLKSGAAVLEAIDREKYEPRDVFIGRDGQWHVHGIPMSPEKALRGVDVAFNVIHGQYGEDGQLQRILEGLAVPYTGSDTLASTIAFNKQHTKDLVSKMGVKVADGMVVERPPVGGDDLEQLALSLFRSFPHPAIVKPVIGGSSVGMTIVNNYHDLEAGLAKAFAITPRALIEEYIAGREATVGIVDGFRGEKSYALFPVEIIPPPKHGFFSYDAKYGGESIERCPGNFSEQENEQLVRFAKLAHEGLGLSHYSRSDFIVSKRGIYFLEINSAAACGLTNESLFPKALRAVGSSLKELVSHVVELAHKGEKR